MNDKKLFLNYLKSLLKNWYVMFALAIEVIGLTILLFTNISVPRWFFFSLLGVAFIVANYQLYRQTQKEIELLQDEHEKQLLGVQAKLNELRNDEPQLNLNFVNNTKRITLTISKHPEPVDYDDSVQKEAATLARKYNELDRPEPTTSEGSSAKDEHSLIRRLQSQSQQQPKSKEEYDEDCGSYLQNYRRYLVEKEKYTRMLNLYRTLVFVIDNSGTQPAKDITAIIDFPDEFHFPTEDEELDLLLLNDDPPKPPAPPSLYRPSPLEMMQQSSAHTTSLLGNISASISPGRTNAEPPNITGPHIRPKNSTEVTYKIRKLVHNFLLELESAGFYLTEDAAGHSLKLSYSIHAGNLRRPVEGSLIVVVEL